ncbi:hypothetical protein POPTR_015G026550v4 [Populus trichocarpa]|uniref:Uncharacterized protein n=1 Tax=Populus trichocarpa TaxID=3694 RepID=A0ACC0RUM8_POPTR|nr:hypothetical protein POPTR_015G026550v4 [Populus trichocarpa]
MSHSSFASKEKITIRDDSSLLDLTGTKGIQHTKNLRRSKQANNC